MREVLRVLNRRKVCLDRRNVSWRTLPPVVWPDHAAAPRCVLERPGAPRSLGTSRFHRDRNQAPVRKKLDSRHWAQTAIAVNDDGAASAQRHCSNGTRMEPSPLRGRPCFKCLGRLPQERVASGPETAPHSELMVPLLCGFLPDRYSPRSLQVPLYEDVPQTTATVIARNPKVM